MSKYLSRSKVLVICLVTLGGYFIFASNTDLSSLGLSSARNPERWSLWRYIVVGSWIVIAIFIYLLRKKQAYKNSFLYATIFSAVIAFVLSSIWIGGSSSYGIVGSAITYSLISGLLCMTISNQLAAGIFGAVLMAIQLAVDIVVLGLAGVFRIH